MANITIDKLTLKEDLLSQNGYTIVSDKSISDIQNQSNYVTRKITGLNLYKSLLNLASSTDSLDGDKQVLLKAYNGSPQRIDYELLANAILNKLINKTYEFQGAINRELSVIDAVNSVSSSVDTLNYTIETNLTPNTIEALNNLMDSNYITNTNLTTTLTNYATTESLNNYATTGSLNSLIASVTNVINLNPTSRADEGTGTDSFYIGKVQLTGSQTLNNIPTCGLGTIISDIENLLPVNGLCSFLSFGNGRYQTILVQGNHNLYMNTKHNSSDNWNGWVRLTTTTTTT